MRVSSNSKMTDAEAKAFSAELKRLRAEAGLTGAAFGELVGCSGVYISQLERGMKKPSPQLAARIAEAFNTTVEEMIGKTKAVEETDENTWEVRKKYGKVLREHREAKCLSPATIANALGIPPYVYREYEQGLCSITDREMDILSKLLGIGEKPEVVVETKTVEVPAEIPAEIYDIILKHIKDLQVDEATQRVVWRYFNQVRVDAEERRLFG